MLFRFARWQLQKIEPTIVHVIPREAAVLDEDTSRPPPVTSAHIAQGPATTPGPIKIRPRRD